jgi:hypothetical protein
LRKSLEKGTDIGFDKKEVQKTRTEDLLMLRKSIVIYLKSKKLKKRNINFMEVYYRINEELKERKNSSYEEKKSEGFVKADTAPKRKTSATILHSASLSNIVNEFEEKSSENSSFLKRKTSSAAVLEVEIPSFFNDKKEESKILQKENEKISSPLKDSISGSYRIY